MPNSNLTMPSGAVQSITPLMDADIQEQASIFEALVMTVQHFFGGFNRLFQGVTDPRTLAYITYPLPTLMHTGVLMYLFRLKARRQVTNRLRGNGPSAAKLQDLFGVEICPHGDTLNALYSDLEVAEVQQVVTDMTVNLIRRKVLYNYRLLDKYFLVAIVGTGMLTSSKRHCPHCMTRTYKGRTLYCHPVLGAILVTSAGFAF